jgi:hypothetical protein
MRHQITESCAIPLDQAWYCESCRVISNDWTCCSCANAEHNQRLALWLDREREPIRVPSTGVFLTVRADMPIPQNFATLLQQAHCPDFTVDK